MENIKLPEATRSRLAAMIQEKNRLEQLINAVFVTAGEALGVPEGWVINDIEQGFTDGIADRPAPPA